MTTFFKQVKTHQDDSVVVKQAARCESTTCAVLSALGPVALTVFDQSVRNFSGEVSDAVIQTGNGLPAGAIASYLAGNIKPEFGENMADLATKARAAANKLPQAINDMLDQKGESLAP